MVEIVNNPRLGLKAGDKGAHTSRTMMLAELSALLAVCDGDQSKADYFEAIIEDNALGKNTVATRKLTAQRISELYSLDRSIPLFRLLLRVWNLDLEGQPLSALLVALARDPLLRATSSSVLDLSRDQPFDREKMKSDLASSIGDRLNESTLDKVVRNAGSSWTQSGHLEGRTLKKRCIVKPTIGPVTMALFLGYIQGFRGTGLLTSFWCRVLDSSPQQISRIASTASMAGLLTFRNAGEVVEVSFPDLLTSSEIDLIHESH
jgi:hypothetical protein